MPMIIASAVIRTGRSRVLPDSITASNGVSDSFRERRSLAKATTRIEFDTDMPTAMMAPISDITLMVVPVSANVQMMPSNAAGNALMMMKGSMQDWNRMTRTA